MMAEVITTGEEVLSGQIIDSNGAWLGQWLAEHGLQLNRRITVGDRMEDLVTALKQRGEQADVLIVNGGLGPTLDDLSAQAAAEAVGEPLVEFPEWVEAMKQRFARMDRPMPPRNLKQAMLPQSAEIIDNPHGTACGFMMTIGKATVFFTPGPPNELKPMMCNQVAPRLRERFSLPPQNYLKKINSFGLTEATVDELVNDLPAPNGVQLGFRAHFPFIETKIMAWGVQSDGFAAETSAFAEAIRERLGEFRSYEDARNLAGKLVAVMSQAGHTLALAESCTGGMIASQLVDVPGSSAVLTYGMVTYSNQAKQDLLKVPTQVLEDHGAVSLECARAMAQGARARAGTSHALAVTGIAGPGGGTEEKPVGTVGFALATPEATHTQVLKLPNWGRNRVRRISATLSLDMLRRHLEGIPIFGSFSFMKCMAKDVTPHGE